MVLIIFVLESLVNDPAQPTGTPVLVHGECSCTCSPLEIIAVYTGVTHL